MFGKGERLCVVALAGVVSSSLLSASAGAAVLWQDDFEYTSHPAFTRINVASGGVWNTHPTDGAFFTRTSNEFHSARPDGGGGSLNTGGGTGGNIFATRSLGSTYSSGILNISGWVDARSNDGNGSNQGGFGLHSSSQYNEPPAVWLRYQSIGADLITLNLGNAPSATSGNADGTATAGGNVWNHLRLEVDLDAQIARMFKDSDPANPSNDVWVQLGSDVATGPLTLTHAAIYTARDGGADDLVVSYEPIPEPASLSLLALVGCGGLVRGRRRRR